MSTKRIYLTRRNPAIKAEDFPREWRRHAALAASFSNVNRRYLQVAQCTKADVAPGALDNDYAGVALLWMESLEVALEVNEDREIIERLRPDEVRVFGKEVVHCSLFAQEHIICKGPTTGAVLIEFLARKDGTSAQEFAQRWQGEHTSRLTGTQAFQQYGKRYAQNLVVQSPPVGYEFDGISETWFDNLDDMARLLNDPAYRDVVNGDRKAYCNVGRTVQMPTKVTHAWSA
jgi:hypothetical protein